MQMFAQLHISPLSNHPRSWQVAVTTDADLGAIYSGACRLSCSCGKPSDYACTAEWCDQLVCSWAGGCTCKAKWCVPLELPLGLRSYLQAWLGVAASHVPCCRLGCLAG